MRSAFASTTGCDMECISVISRRGQGTYWMNHSLFGYPERKIDLFSTENTKKMRELQVFACHGVFQLAK